mgnify:CR=1 FL=1
MEHPKNAYDAEEVGRLLENVPEMIKHGAYDMASQQLHSVADLVLEQRKYLEVLRRIPEQR